MPDYLLEFAAALTRSQIRMPGPDGGFAPVEQIWHLADLESEGFGERIRRLMTETRPLLPDFNGTRAARERNYLALSPEAGLKKFTAARMRNLATLRGLDAAAWLRPGMQDGVGEVSLCDMPVFMHQHDAAHKAEIELWRRSHVSS
jgi:hypothetical protein